MFRYVILTIYPLLFLASALAVYQTSKLAKVFPSRAWAFKRKLMFVFMVFQVYGVMRTWTVNRVFTWADPIYLVGVLILCIGINWFERLLLKDARSLRSKAARPMVIQAIKTR